MPVFSLEDEQIISPSDVNLCRTVDDLLRTNRLGKIVFPDGQISDDLFVEKFVCPVFISDDLFVWDDLSVQIICSSSSVKTANDTQMS